MAVECGFTLSQARKHSLAQLKLLSEAARRHEAKRGLLNLRVVFAAVAAGQCKENARVLEKLQKELLKQIE